MLMLHVNRTAENRRERVLTIALIRFSTWTFCGITALFGSSWRQANIKISWDLGSSSPKNLMQVPKSKQTILWLKCACPHSPCSYKIGEYVLDLITELEGSDLGVRFDSCTLRCHECLVLGQNEFNHCVWINLTLHFCEATIFACSWLTVFHGLSCMINREVTLFHSHTKTANL